MVRVLSGPAVYGILIPQSESENRSVVSNSLQSHGLYSPWNSPGQDTEVGSLSRLQGIFPIQGSNLRLLYWQAGSSPLSYQTGEEAGWHQVMEVGRQAWHCVPIHS